MVEFYLFMWQSYMLTEFPADLKIIFVLKTEQLKMVHGRKCFGRNMPVPLCFFFLLSLQYNIQQIFDLAKKLLD